MRIERLTKGSSRCQKAPSKTFDARAAWRVERLIIRKLEAEDGDAGDEETVCGRALEGA